MNKDHEAKHVPAKIPKIESTPLKWVKNHGDPKPTVVIGQHLNEVGNSDELLSKRSKEIVGVKDTELANNVIGEAARAIEPMLGAEQSKNIVAQSLNDFQPKDVIEARLAAQAAVAHTYAMKSIKQCGDADMLCHIESMANLGIKFMRVYNESVDALMRYKRGGIQQVVVQHQNNVVADKAIVNNITGVGIIAQNQGDTPCQQNAVQKQESINIVPVDSRQCPTGGADCMAEKVRGPKPKKGASG